MPRNPKRKRTTKGGSNPVGTNRRKGSSVVTPRTTRSQTLQGTAEIDIHPNATAASTPRAKRQCQTHQGSDSETLLTQADIPGIVENVLNNLSLQQATTEVDGSRSEAHLNDSPTESRNDTHLGK